jgi:hypothetical protein
VIIGSEQEGASPADRVHPIFLYAKRDIEPCEELCYDYHLPLESQEKAIPCLCGAPSCKGWLNWDHKREDASPPPTKRQLCEARGQARAARRARTAELLGDIQELEPDNDLATDVILEVLGQQPDAESDEEEEDGRAERPAKEEPKEIEEEELGEEVESESDDAPRKRHSNRKRQKKDKRRIGEGEEPDNDLPKMGHRKTSPKKRRTETRNKKRVLEKADDGESTVKSRGKGKVQHDAERPLRISPGVTLLGRVLDLDSVSEEEDVPGSRQPKRRQRRKSIFKEGDQLEVD